MTPTPPPVGQVTVDTADRPLLGVTKNVGAVLLGHDADGRPTVEVRLGYALGASVTWSADVVKDADLLEDYAHALMTAADHLRSASDGE